MVGLGDSIFSDSETGQMSSIFNRIFQYRQREQRTPREDYFTETFVAVIEKYDELRIALAGWLAGVEVEKIQSVRIETQRSFSVADSGNRRRPDIWMEVQDVDDECHWIIVENKIDSGEGENQLADYAKILEACSGLKTKTLVYITKFSSSTDPPCAEEVKFKHLRWPDVYDFLRKKLRDANGSRELANELLKLMEDWNMDGKLNKSQLRSAVIYFDSDVGAQLRRIQDDAWVSSGIDSILVDKMNQKRWSKGFGGYSSDIPGYGINLWMGFQFSRRDKDWNVEDIELPSPFVAVNPIKENKQIGESLRQPSNGWKGPRKVKVRNYEYKWVRQPIEKEMPRLGEPLDDFYKNFFQRAFDEIKRALEAV